MKQSLTKKKVMWFVLDRVSVRGQNSDLWVVGRGDKPGSQSPAMRGTLTSQEPSLSVDRVNQNVGPRSSRMDTSWKQPRGVLCSPEDPRVAGRWEHLSCPGASFSSCDAPAIRNDGLLSPDDHNRGSSPLPKAVALPLVDCRRSKGRNGQTRNLRPKQMTFRELAAWHFCGFFFQVKWSFVCPLFCFFFFNLFFYWRIIALQNCVIFLQSVYFLLLDRFRKLIIKWAVFLALMWSTVIYFHA